MGLFNRRRDTPSETVENLRQQLAIAEANLELVQQQYIAATSLHGEARMRESVASLEHMFLSDPEWMRVTAASQVEFTEEGLRRIREICRVASIANPLLRRALSLRSAYVWGNRVEIQVRGNNTDDDVTKTVIHKIQDVVNQFWNDPLNQQAVTGAIARDRLERTLGTDGELFIALFTDSKNGHVRARVIGADSITRIYTSPGDRNEHRFYQREWDEITYRDDGTQKVERKKELHPSINYRPIDQPSSYAGLSVRWDAPIIHVAVNQPEGWLRGIPDVFSALNWARAYKEFLENWATLMKSLARFAWLMTTNSPGARDQAVKRLTAAPMVDPSTGEPLKAGHIGMLPRGAMLEPVRLSGATIDADSGRPLATMVASALDLPVTMLLADPGQTGARAVAETLDQPTELVMQHRRELWISVFTRILHHVIFTAVEGSRLPGKIQRDSQTGERILQLDGDVSYTIDINIPDLDDPQPDKQVSAVVQAANTGTMPPDLVLRLLLNALQVPDIDGIMRRMVDESGRFVWPEGPWRAAAGLGDEATQLASEGDDPATAGAGSMTHDDE